MDMIYIKFPQKIAENFRSVRPFDSPSVNYFVPTDSSIAEQKLVIGEQSPAAKYEPLENVH